MNKLRGFLNKVTDVNVQLLAKEARTLEVDDYQLAGKMIFERALAEIQNAVNIGQLVKENEGLREAFLSRATAAITFENIKADPKRASRAAKLLCVVRSEGMISASAFDCALQPLAKFSGEEVAESLAAVHPFRLFISHSTFQKLTERAEDIIQKSASVRLQLLCEEYARPLSSDSDSSAEFIPEKKVAIQRIPTSCTVYISNIDCEATEWELFWALKSFGEVCKVRLCGNPRHSTQYAFVEFLEEKSAKTAIAKDGRCLLGKAALRMSASKSVIQDACETDAILSPNGFHRPCTFGFPNGRPSSTKIRHSPLQQSQKWF